MLSRARPQAFELMNDVGGAGILPALGARGLQTNVSEDQEFTSGLPAAISAFPVLDSTFVLVARAERPDWAIT